MYCQQGECAAPDPPTDESHQRGTEMDVLGVGLEDQEDEVLEDGMVTPPVYLTPSRSLSRLRVDSHRVRAHSLNRENLRQIACKLNGRADTGQ